MSRRVLLGCVFFLTLCQGLIGQFAIHGVPLFLRAEGQSSEVIGLVFLAGIPFALRAIWAPVIDRLGGGPLGPYGTWIIAAQGLAVAAMIALSASDPAGTIAPILACLLIAMFALGTQQSATAALMIGHLSEGDHSRGSATMAIGSTTAGVMLGFGVLYLLAGAGWESTVLALAAAAAGLLIVLVTGLRLDRGHPPAREVAGLLSHFQVFRQRDVRLLFARSALVSTVVIIPYGLKSVLLIDAGFSVSDSGLIGIVFGNLCGLCAALGTRPLIDRYGPWPTFLMIAALANLITLGAAAALWAGYNVQVTITVLILSANGVVFAIFTIVRSLLMPLCQSGRTATDFATFAAVEGVVILVFASLGSAALDSVGVTAVLLAGSAISVTGTVWLASTMRRPEASV